MYNSSPCLLTCARACVAQVSLSPVIRREEHAAQEQVSQQDAATPSQQVAALAAREPSAEQETDSARAEDESAAAVGGSGLRTVPVPYVVGPHDTWQSICLRHRMTSAELLELNGLRNRRARVGDVLMVWAERSDEQQNEDWKRQLVRQFRRLTGCGNSEALYYLELHEYAIGDAIRERTKDVSFESERAVVVRTILDEDAMRARLAAEEEAQKKADELRAAELVAEARKAQARAAALAEAHRSLNACLAPPNRVNSTNAANCLACLG